MRLQEGFNRIKNFNDKKKNGLDRLVKILHRYQKNILGISFQEVRLYSKNCHIFHLEVEKRFKILQNFCTLQNLQNQSVETQDQIRLESDQQLRLKSLKGLSRIVEYRLREQLRLGFSKLAETREIGTTVQETLESVARAYPLLEILKRVKESRQREVLQFIRRREERKQNLVRSVQFLERKV